MFNLEGKVALISGAARGQGEIEARLFAELGAKVVIADLREEEGKQVANSIGLEKAMFCELDVTSRKSWTAAVQAAQERFGELNVLVNNAGIVCTGSIEHQSEEEYMVVVRVNQLGTYLGMQTAIPALRAAGGGSIVNIASNAANRGAMNSNAYVASKWAVRGMTKTAALELGKDKIRVNSVHPGVINTAMVQWDKYSEEQKQAVVGNFALPRIGEPQEVATMVAFLASDAASYSTGAEFMVDGGAIAGNAHTAFKE
ncbi:glucose 1-dehydrogenase [Pseudomaricurvus alkylphenolicus]|jgi:3alpha(or 20beta)-hydroxysteroid dehydrogenase|uniref:glucose 1-dehydrogenase n=1 Tax=Pseudomaricurvus alkylphenolicus TaxID=1306991 RepID=UPI0014249795|nr:glucose 1-dehydrogenase [Pseudomaricurvus alkylphenolicus]NIB38957.1 glucose 1-dehydrogenase [Pseudomaricurvus alkylphenolicus]